ncbi:MAG: hypothetical protein FWH22_07500 [Fibromonadales bacterium]|nr:hypothetical protein [Fibromonadales bacterium]
MASTDWLPTTREAVLQMAMKWNNQLAMKGTAWSVPEPKVTELNTLTLSAQAAYNEANTKDRTKVLTAKMNAAFKALTDAMRDIKKRYFYIPYYCIRYENNKGDKGPWGPMVNAVIP